MNRYVKLNEVNLTKHPELSIFKRSFIGSPLIYMPPKSRFLALIAGLPNGIVELRKYGSLGSAVNAQARRNTFRPFIILDENGVLVVGLY